MMPVPTHIQPLLDRTIALLAPVQGVQAVVLGGSHARGIARPDSDLDLGLYYCEATPFAIADIQKAAAQLSGRVDQEVTDFYGWGAWVNGGGWLHTPDGKVDFLYRNLDQVERTIADARRGITHHDYDQQPAYGFYSVMYLAETSICLPLYDPHGWISRLKRQVEEYPPLLKAKTVSDTLWLAEFSLIHADGFARSGNGYALTGTLTRAASYLTQALFALNETYFLSDKTAIAEMAHFKRLPQGYVEHLLAILSHTGLTQEEMMASVQALHGLWSKVVELTEGTYTPAFKL
jgi:predicted nucleotidyltransferase